MMNETQTNGAQNDCYANEQLDRSTPSHTAHAQALTKDDEVSRADAGNAGCETICRETLDICGFARGRSNILAVTISAHLTEGVDLRHELVRAGDHSSGASCLV